MLHDGDETQRSLHVSMYQKSEVCSLFCEHHWQRLLLIYHCPYQALMFQTWCLAMRAGRLERAQWDKKAIMKIGVLQKFWTMKKMQKTKMRASILQKSWVENGH